MSRDLALNEWVGTTQALEPNVTANELTSKAMRFKKYKKRNRHAVYQCIFKDHSRRQSRMAVHGKEQELFEQKRI